MQKAKSQKCKKRGIFLILHFDRQANGISPMGKNQWEKTAPLATLLAVGNVNKVAVVSVACEEDQMMDHILHRCLLDCNVKTLI